MKFSFAITSNLGIETNITIKLEENILELIKLKNYGQGIETYIIGIKIIEPNIQQMFKVRSPSFIEGPKTVKVHNITFTIVKSFSCSFILDYEEFKNSNDFERKKILTKNVINSFDYVRNLIKKKKIKDFDIDSFSNDLVEYFTKEKLIG